MSFNSDALVRAEIDRRRLALTAAYPRHHLLGFRRVWSHLRELVGRWRRSPRFRSASDRRSASRAIAAPGRDVSGRTGAAPRSPLSVQSDKIPVCPVAERPPGFR